MACEGAPLCPLEPALVVFLLCILAQATGIVGLIRLRKKIKGIQEVDSFYVPGTQGSHQSSAFADNPLMKLAVKLENGGQLMKMNMGLATTKIKNAARSSSKVMPLKSRMLSKDNMLRRNNKRKEWEISAKDIKIITHIASGSFGSVYLGEWCDITVAIKKPSKGIPKAMHDKFVDEIDLMTKLHHPNIVSFLGACISVHEPFLVIEYLENGSLFDFMHKPCNAKKITYRRILKFALDTARGMRYLHSRCKIVQRDLKSRNLLLDRALNVKICDFGLSRLSEKDVHMTACGTPCWAAPEVILGEKYDIKADVFSFAIVLWELLTLEEPFKDRPGIDTAIEVAQTGLRLEIPDDCPKDYEKLMVSCWEHSPRNRPSFDRILEILHGLLRDARIAEEATAQKIKAMRSR